jgi:hypothetical protein
MSKLKLEELAVESFETGAVGGARGTVRGLSIGGIDGINEPDQPDQPSEPDEPSDPFPGGSGFNSCQTCIFVTCGTCPDQV